MGYGIEKCSIPDNEKKEKRQNGKNRTAKWRKN